MTALADALGDPRIPEALRRAVADDEVGALVADASRVLEANDPYLALVGFDRAQLEAGELSWLRLTPAEHLPADSRAIGAARATGLAPSYEKQYVMPGGERVDVVLSLLLLTEEPLRIFAVVAAGGDERGRALVDALVP